MKQKAKYIFLLYWFIAFADILFIYFEKDTLRWITKPLLIPVLAFAFYTSSYYKKGSFYYFILAALFLSWGGDVLLQFKGLFIPGLISFLLAHVFYILYFAKTNAQRKGLLQFQPLIGLPVLIYIVLFLYLLYPFLDSLKIPVTVYGITIGTMLLMSINTRRKVSDNAAALFFNGALQFVISDSLLAVNMFAVKRTLLSVSVMLTYASAQYLIVKGALVNERN
jgi:uncharacterized membrane protein YhhN